MPWIKMLSGYEPMQTQKDQENNYNDIVLETTPILKFSFHAGYLDDEGKYWSDVMVGPEEHHVKSLSSIHG